MPVSYNKNKSKSKNKFKTASSKYFLNKRQTRKLRMQKGGNRQMQKGGKGWGYGTPVGAPFEQAYVSTWGKSNYYPLSPTGIPVGGNDPAIPSNPQFSFSGGAKARGSKARGAKARGAKKTKRMMRGGGLFSDFTDAYRTVWQGAGRMLDTYNGNLSPANSYPSPTSQHLLNDTNNSDYLLSVPYKLPNINEIHYNAGRYVGMMGGGKNKKRGGGVYDKGDVVTIENMYKKRFPAIFLGPNKILKDYYALWAPDHANGAGGYTSRKEEDIFAFEGTEEEKTAALTAFENREYK
jgi:hypothetical protein